MEIVKAWLDYLLQWATYASVCIEQPIQAPACRPFWTLAMFAFFGVGALVVLVIAWRIALLPAQACCRASRRAGTRQG